MTSNQHSPTSSAVLITGGTGKVGRRVARRLLAGGHDVRIGSRSGTPPFSWDDPDGWPDALTGMDAAVIVYAPDLALPGAAEAVDAFARCAVEHGVRRLVLLSGRGEEGAQRAEDFVIASGAATTVVRASVFAQNFDEGLFVDSLRMEGVVAVPAGEVREPFVDVEDIADVIVAALQDDRHAGRVYEVTGPESITFAAAVAELSRAAGRPLRYIPVSGPECREQLVAAGVPTDEAAGLVELFVEIFDGRNEATTDGVREALGRPPRSFAEYAAAAAATGVWTDDRQAAR